MSVNDAPRIVIDNSRVMLQIVESLTDESRGVIYNRMFIVEATASVWNKYINLWTNFS